MNRNGMEILLLDSLRDLKGLEGRLDRQFSGLEFAPRKRLREFVRGLTELEVRVRHLERVVDILDDTANLELVEAERTRG